ncbi:MAG TPA: class E sortase [Acidimicrobiales bacterium]|nr:class E sortase [Acidimicrobiales bacterium]
MASEASGRHRGARAGTALRWGGGAVLGVGVLALLVVAYQFAGTWVSESLHQHALRARFEAELAGAPHDRPGPAPTRLAGPDGPPVTAPPAAAPPERQPVGIIDIPSIGVDQVVVEGVAEGDLAVGPGHYPGTPLPGAAGNAGIAGHRTTYGHPFWSLDALTPGRRILVVTRQGRFVYVVRRTLVVAPGDVGVLAPSAVPELTLTTCTPRFSAAQRLVVQASLVASALFWTRPGGPGPVRPTARGADPGRPPGGGGPLAPVTVAALAAVAAVGALGGAWAGRRTRHARALLVLGAAIAGVAVLAGLGAAGPLLPTGF